VTAVFVGDGYFDAIDVPVRGRVFTAGDGAPGREAAVVNERFVTLHFEGRDPLGQRIQLTNENAPAGAGLTAWASIVGVAPTVRQSLTQESDPLGDPVVYLPFRSDAGAGLTLLVRGTGDLAPVVAQVRDAVRVIDPDLAIFNVRTLDEEMAISRWPFRVFGSMFAIFAVIALVLSAVGLYAVTARSVAQRTPEIGVRLVLGALPSGIQWLILRQSMVKVAIGLALGMAGALGAGRLLNALLVVGDRDPITLVSIAIMLALVAVVATLLPARRAARLDPMAALRDE
jgi:putative ABC transport system permease protein